MPTAAIVVEVRSPDDETYDKFAFSFEHGVEEILVADLASKSVRWFVRSPGTLVANERSQLLGLTNLDVAKVLKWAD